MEAFDAMELTTAPGGYTKSFLQIGGNYNTAAIDLRNAANNGTSHSYPAPTVTVTLGSPSTTIHVSNVMPFTSDFLGRDINTGHTNTVYVNGDAYTETGYAFTGTVGTAGTLTMSGSVSIADGTSGNSVAPTNNTIWLGTGGQIAFDTQGNHNLYYSTTILSGAGGLFVPNSNLEVNGQIYTPQSMTVGGTLFAGGAATLNATGTGLTVAHNASIGGTLTVGGVLQGPLTATAVVANGSIGALPATAKVRTIYVQETAGHAVAGGVNIGTTSSGSDMASAIPVAASGKTTINPGALLVQQVGGSTIYISAASAWAGASLNVQVEYDPN